MKNNWLIPSFILSGLVLLGLSFLIAKKTDSNLFNQKPLARIESTSGQVFILHNNMTAKEKLARKSFVYSADSVETSSDGDAVLEFDSAFRVRVLENTLVTVEEEKERTNLVIKRGELQVENYGQEGRLTISRDGKRWTANDYENIYKKQIQENGLSDDPNKVAASDNSNNAEAAAPVAATPGLTAEYIQDNLRGHRNAFFKCYTQMLQRTPGISGQAQLSFTIEKTGKISQGQVSSTNINDPQFKRCLVDALQRIEFKSFAGEAIATVFPIRFE